MKKTVCVTGGSGGIGQTLLPYLLESFHVKALFRKESATSAKWQKQGCQIVLGDVKDDSAIANLVAGTEFVFHCAAVISSFSSLEAHEVNVEGTRKLAQAAAISGCKRFIYLSSIAVYAGVELEENSYREEVQLREDPTMDLYCLTKLRAETALREIATQYNLEYVILRPTCVYGPAVPSYTTVPINTMRKGLPVILGDGAALLDVVYVEDVVRAMLLAANSPAANGEIFNIGGETITCKEFYAYYGRMLQQPIRRISQKTANIAKSLTSIHKEFGKSVKWYFKIQETAKEYPSTKAKQLLGYTPQVPLVVGMLKTQLWLQAHDYIPAKPHVFHSAVSLYSFSPRAAVYPTTEAEIVQIVREAAQQNLKVRAIGAIHSHAPIPATEGVCIVLDRYKNVVYIEGSQVTVQAGMKIWELNEVLAKHNLALPIVGGIDKQTVSGAVATGTHGSSLHHTSLSGYVQAVRLIRADGSVIQVDRSQDIFNGIVLSMGLLGIISTVTFNCVPAFALQSQKCTMPMAALIERFADIQQTNKYVNIRYTPITDTAQFLLINPAEEAIAQNSGWNPVVSSKMGRKLKTFVTKLAMRLFHNYKLNGLQRLAMKQYEDTMYASPCGQSDFVFTHFEATNDEPIAASDMEIAVPYSQAGAALTAIRDRFQKTQRYHNIPVHIRCAAREDFWLSPAYKQDICWIEFWEYPRTDKFFKEMVELLKPFNFRCHWGKQIVVEPQYLKQQYEKWQEFVELRQEWDFQGMFANPCLDKYFVSKPISSAVAKPLEQR